MPVRPPSERPLRRLSHRQAIRRLKSILLDIGAIGGGYGLSAGELRLRALTLRVRIQELYDRFPRG